MALVAGLGAGSIALVGFGADSLIECASGIVLIWRLLSERRNSDSATIELLEKRAQKLVGGSLALLAIYVALGSVHALATHGH